MARLSWLQRLYWRHLSKPVAYRALFEYLIEHPIASILEVGIGDGKRLEQVLSLVNIRPGVKQLRYAGVDLFESGDPKAGHLRLKDVKIWELFTTHSTGQEVEITYHISHDIPSN